ncbi:MAG: tyrosine-type recombinase/integrase [Burkholderiales bacterium]|nr:tyrosine-type recombinase/integrase [Burkholderiales bacterium]
MAQKRHVNYTLKPAAIDNAKPREKAYALTDGGGLYIDILPGGSKVWRFKYHRDGRREKVTIGQYPSISIKDARDRHEALREQLHKGDSPARAKQQEAAERRAVEARSVDFRAFAQRWIRETLFARSETYRAQIARWLDSYVYPAIGDRALDKVTPADVLAIIEKRQDTAVTAERIRVIIQQIFNYAIRKLLVETNPAQPLRGSIARPGVEHHRHLSEKELARFWRQLGEQGAHATTIAASRLLLLTMTRKSELLRSKWPEFDLDAGQWDIPAERMKMGKPHRVFLSTQAVELLRQVYQLTGHGEYVFPSIFRGSVPMGDVTLNHFFKRIDFGVPDFSPHGTRSTAATLLREHGFGRDVVELLLAHSEKNATVAAYSHMELAPERKRALQFLADYVEKLAAGGEVIPLRAA